MTNVSRSSVVFFLVALMMLQPLTSIDYDLEASQEPSFSSTGSESISVSLNQTHAANDDPIMAFVHVQNLSSTSSYSIDWLICLGNRTDSLCPVPATYVDANGNNAPAVGSITIPSGLTSFSTNFQFETNLTFGNINVEANRSYSIITNLNLSQVYVTHDRKSFLNAGDDDDTDAWRYHWDTMGTDFALPILDNAFIPGSSIDLYYGYYGIYTIEDTMLQSNVILSDLNGTIINQNTYQYNESQTSSIRHIHSGYHGNGGAYDPIDMSGPNTVAPGDYVVSIEISYLNINYNIASWSQNITVINAHPTGNETVEIELNQTHFAHDDPGSVNVSVTGLNSSQSYSIEWLICLGNRTDSLCQIPANYVDANGNNAPAVGSITIPSGSTSFSTNFQFDTNLTFGSRTVEANRSYSIITNLNLSQVYVTHDRKSFLNAGDDDLTSYWYYNWDTMGTDFALPILDNAFIPGSSIDLYYGYYGIYTIEDTMLQSNVILSDLNGTIINQNAYQYNETHTSAARHIHSGYHGNGGAYDPIDMSGPNTVAPGDYVVSLEISYLNINYIIASWSQNITVVNAYPTGNETVEIELNQTHFAHDDPGSVNVSVTGLNSSQSYSIEWMICLGNRTDSLCPVPATYVDANGNTAPAVGSITIPSGLTSFSTNFQFDTNLTFGSHTVEANRSYSIITNLNLSQVYVTHDRKSFLNAGDDDLTDHWAYRWYTMGTDFALPILDNAFLPGSSIDFYYGYTSYYVTEDTIVQSNVILSDLNGTIINQNTYQYTHPNVAKLWVSSGRHGNGGAYDPIDMSGPNTVAPGDYVVSLEISYLNINYTIASWSQNITVLAQTGIADNSTMSIAAGDGYANFSFAQQDLNEWYTVYWNLTNASNAVVDSGNFGYISNAVNYYRNVTTISGLPMGAYCLEASLYVGNQGNYLQNSTEDCYSLVLDDADGDGVGDGADQCPNTPAGESVNAVGCSDSQLDDDGDAVTNDVDQCPNTPAGESVNAVGCSDSQLDDDNDGVNNDVDQCPNTPAGETVDANGCTDAQLDDDNDGVNNDADQCPNTPVGESVNAVGCSESQLDDDGDGITNDIDLCPNTYAGDPVDADGCSQYQLDDDGDGVNNAVDQCPGTPPGVPVMAQGCPNSDYDADQDGVVDSDDLCGETPAGSTVDANGCTPDQLIDTDGDGVKDQFDQCPDTVAGETVDAQGCSDDQQDDDNDGIPNGEDNCANTEAGANPDANGCSEEQRDDDGDGYNNGVDDCPQSPSGASVDTNGCAESELDDDNDLITNDIDDCANTPAGETVDAVGCSQSQLDPDLDGVYPVDDCPNTPVGEAVNAVGCSQSQIDDDGDGVSNANDQCPNTPAGTVVDAKGCPTPDTLPKPTSPKCDIYYSLESQGVKLNGDAAIPSVSGFGGVIAIPPGSYYVIASCSDPDGDIVNATILTPIAEQSGAGKQFTVGALIQVPEGMNETMPIMIAWNDGKEFYQASFIIKLGEIPEDIDTSNGEGIPGFTAMTMMTAFLIAGWIQGRRRLENQS